MPHSSRVPSTNGDPRGSRTKPAPGAPPEIGPSRLGTALLALVMLAWVFAFTPDPRVIATIPGILGYLALIERCRTWRETVLWTILFGAVATGIGYRWLAQTVQDFGGVSVPVSWVAVVLFGIWNTMHGWIFAAFYRGLLRSRRRPSPLLTVILFVACESLPIRMFGWMSGHGAVNVPPLLQHAEWGGVAGVSLVLGFLVVPLYEMLRAVVVRHGPPARVRAAVLTFALGALLYGFGIHRYDQVRGEELAAPKHVRVGIVQPNVGTHAKRGATEGLRDVRAENIARYRAVTQEAVEAGAEVLVWPESAITDPVPMDHPYKTNQFLRTVGYDFLIEAGRERALLVGLYEAAFTRGRLGTGKAQDKRYNDAALRQPGEGDQPWTAYRKVHLIPFGETMPFGIAEDRLPQDFRMIPGALPQPLLEGWGLTFAPFICYEAILPSYVNDYIAGRHPDVLVSLTNDSWFGDTWEPHQHLNFTRFRAVEHRAPLVRATNTGISAFVSATGDVEASLGVGVQGALVRDVPIVERGPTLYARLGYRLPWLLWAIALLGWLLALARRD